MRGLEQAQQAIPDKYNYNVRTPNSLLNNGEGCDTFAGTQTRRSVRRKERAGGGGLIDLGRQKRTRMALSPLSTSFAHTPSKIHGRRRRAPQQPTD